jgi:leucyl-tRNA synthetase
VVVTASEEEIKSAALRDAKTKEWIGSFKVQKIIVIPNKLISIVAS